MCTQLRKAKTYYKAGDFESIVKENRKDNIDKIISKEILFITALAFDQLALRKKKKVMRDMQKTASEYATAIINKFPAWDKGYFAMGIISQHSGNSDIALNYYRKAQKINPNNSSYYLSLGNGYRSAKKFKLAISWYKKALLIGEIKHLAAVNLVSLYEELKLKGKMLEYARKSLSLLKNKKDAFSRNQTERMMKILKSN